MYHKTNTSMQSPTPVFWPVRRRMDGLRATKDAAAAAATRILKNNKLD